MMERMMSKTFIAVVVLLLANGCAKQDSLIDIREIMLQSAKVDDKSFPDDIHVKLVQFSYIGTVRAESFFIRVVHCRSVIVGMPAPRGAAWLAFFDTKGEFVGRKEIDARALPLECIGSRVHFFESQSDGKSFGNALELGGGIHKSHYVEIGTTGSGE